MKLDWNELGAETRYLRRYLQLIQEFKHEKKVKGDYLERHHVFPTAIFGKNDSIVILDIRTHVLAHELIWRHLKEIKHKSQHKMALPLTRMMGIRKNQFDKSSTKFSSRQLSASRKMMHEAMRGENNPFYGKTHSVETKAAISAKNTGRKASEEECVKSGARTKEMWKDEKYRSTMINALKNRVVTDETRAKLSKSSTGRTASPETCLKISRAKLGKSTGPKSEETKLKMSISQKGKTKTAEHVDKINRNPEKIRKTAEKHRGMKRTAETCNNISKAKTGIPSPFKGQKQYFNPTNGDQIFLQDGTTVPPGFVRGNKSLKGKCGGAGKIWWYSESLQVKNCFLPGEEPSGWTRGNPKSIKKK